MTVEQTLQTRLNTLADTYPLSLPEQPTLPAIVYQRIDTKAQRNHSESYFDKMRFQVTIYSHLYSEVRSLAASVINLLDLNKTDFILGYKEQDIDVKEMETNLYSTILDFFIFN